MPILSDIDAWLRASFGDMGPLYAMGVLGVLLVALTLPVMLRPRRDPLDRLKESRRGAASEARGARPALRHDSGHAEKLDKFADFLEPQDAQELSTARLRMLQAGYRSKSAVRSFHFAQFALGLGFLAAGALYTLIRSASGPVDMQSAILWVILPGGIGYYLPKYWVTRRIQSRQEEIVNGFPDSLDMMLVCVEAGQSMDQAILRVAREMRAGFPALADEYEIVSAEIKAGKDKTQVYRDFAERAGVQDVSSFVTVLIQSATFGTSIAEALRVYAAEMRDKRVMRAEEKANVLPTKLMLGTMMFCLPPLLIILIGPSIYDIIQNLQNF
jgi:tight adherence protein C